jgi:flagellin-like hook-associated protein FlgL
MSLLRINSDSERVLAQRNAARADGVVERAMERLSSGSILSSAGTSLLAQANQANQGVLSLIR